MFLKTERNTKLALQHVEGFSGSGMEVANERPAALEKDMNNRYLGVLASQSGKVVVTGYADLEVCGAHLGSPRQLDMEISVMETGADRHDGLGTKACD